jgi:colanic acid/amylovoran biosynthesis protein
LRFSDTHASGFFLRKDLELKKSSPDFKVHIIHVGSMNNKGAEVLLKCDIQEIRKLMGDSVSITISTSDLNGVRNLRLPIDKILAHVVDIPYDQADLIARRGGHHRRGFVYKLSSALRLAEMLLEASLCVFSSFLVKIGLPSFYRPEVLHRVKDCDLVISCSDENFKEGTIFFPQNPYWTLTWWSVILSRTWAVLLAKFYGKRVIMFPNSVGPFKTIIGRLLSRLALNSHDLILVREPISYEMLERMNVKSPRILTYDTSFLLDSASSCSMERTGQTVVGVSLGLYSHVFSMEKVNELVSSFARSLDRIVEEFKASIFMLPHYVSGFQYDDLEFSKTIMNRMKNHDNVVIVETRSAEELKSALCKMDLVISSKMHPCILSLSAYVPTLCIAYDHKQIGLFEGLGLSKCAFPLVEMSDNTLFSNFSYLWKNQRKIREQLEKTIPIIQENVKDAIERAILFIRGMSPPENIRGTNARCEVSSIGNLASLNKGDTLEKYHEVLQRFAPQFSHHKRVITDEILKKTRPVSIYLVGSFGRDEGSFSFTQASPHPFRDYDVILVTEKEIEHDIMKSISKNIHSRLGLSDPNLASSKYRGFFVWLTQVTTGYLNSMPLLKYFELKKQSKLLWGRDIRKDIRLTFKDVSKYNGLLILFSKIECLLNLIDVKLLQEGDDSKDKVDVVYECMKTYVEFGTCACLLAGNYLPTFLERSAFLSENFSSLFPELKKCETPIPSRVADFCLRRLLIQRDYLNKIEVNDLLVSTLRDLKTMIACYIERAYCTNYECSTNDLSGGHFSTLGVRIIEDLFNFYLRKRIGLNNRLLRNWAVFLYLKYTQIKFFVAGRRVGLPVKLTSLLRPKENIMLTSWTLGYLLLDCINLKLDVDRHKISALESNLARIVEHHYINNHISQKDSKAELLSLTRTVARIIAIADVIFHRK